MKSVRMISVASLALIGMLAAEAVPAARKAPAPPREHAAFAEDPYPSSYRPLPRHDIAIVGATVLDGAGNRIDDGEILIRDGRIVAVGRTVDRTGATLIQAKGRWVTPGIIDIHSHNGTAVSPSTSVDENASDVSEMSDPNVAETWIEHAVFTHDPGFSRALAGGVTTLQILPGSSTVFGGRSVVLKPVPATSVQAMKFPGAPQGMKMACGENAKVNFGASGRLPTSRQGEVALIRAAFIKARAYIRDWAAYEAGKTEVAPKRDLQLDTLAGVLRGDIRLNWHCYRADDMATMLATAREFDFKVASFHHATEAYKIPDLLSTTGTCAAVWSDWWGFKMEAADAIRENAAFIDASGGCAIMHSDSAEVGQRLNIEAAKAAGAGRRAGLTLAPEHIIKWVTSNPARALGMADRIGTITPGYNADLVIWSGDPFSIYTKADQVLIDGAIAYDRAAPDPGLVSDFELGRPERESR